VIAERLSKTLPVSFSLGKIEIGPVIAPKTLAKQKAMQATINITRTVAERLDILTPFKIY
jgi:uncharacterized membrane protein